MILKNLEILGYKSFADRVRIEFGCGITGIVGPNGCGKTNLGDALRWVLGEQNPRLLRGQRMEDMLFGGSQGRRSTGLAEVSLTFDNSGGLFPLDLTELSVCRRLYGSGESEYLVNGAACRLKDVLALFYDTGIGRDAYSVFDRPRLEGLIAARPEDRRLFLEEVAGIVKHKNRKREAIRKLEETRQALVRLGDILKELELQLEPLRRQAEAARDFRTLRDEMQSLERSTVLSDLTGLRRQVNLFQEKEADIGARREVLKASLGALTETLTHTRSQEGKVSTELETRGEAISRLGALLQKAGARLELAKQSEARLHGEQERRQAEEETFSRRLEGIREAAAEAESALAATGTELEALQAEIPGMSREIEAFHRNLAESSREIEGLKVDLFDLLRTESSLRNQASQAKGQLEAMERRNSALARSESEAAQRLAAARKKREELDGRVKDAVAKAQSLRTLLAEGSAAAAGKEQRLGEITAEIQDLRSKLAHAESKLAALDELARDQEGYPEGARALLASGKASIQGTLADLLKVPADLEEAVAAALGDAVKYILVNDAEEALPLLAWLRDEDRGRATVFPLSCLQEGRRPVSSEAEPRLFPGLVGRAAELAGRDTSPALRSLLEHFLGDIWVARDLESARTLARGAGFKTTVVTLRGEIVHAGGAISGGGRAEGTGLLSRTREVVEFRALAAALRGRLEELEQARKELQAELADRRLDLVRKRQALEEGEKGLRLLRGEMSRASAEEASAEREISKIRHEVESYREALDEGHRKIDAAESELGRINAGRSALEEKIAGLEQARVDRRNRKESVEARLTGLRIREAGLAEARRAREKTLDDLRLQEAEYASLVEKHRAERATRAQSGELWAARVRVLGLRREKINRLREALIGGRDNLRAERNQLIAAIQVHETSLIELRREEEGLAAEGTSLSVRKARLEVEVDLLLGRLSTDFNLAGQALTEALEGNPTRPTDRKGAVDRVLEIRSLIEAMGPVNLGAVADYERVRQRYDDLSAQRDDLNAACEALDRLIVEIDNEMGIRFRTTFEEVRTHFQGIFRELFQGGEADLIATGDERWRIEGQETGEPESGRPEAGIEITAAPPGKRRRHLSLLSGGERCLVSLALFFAVLKTRATPFCLLDEVDTALDEANVRRLGRLLQELSSATQFIVITHRRPMMEATDILYGVTMDDTGVSRIVSVRLVDGTEKITA